ncbi:hypothetical protein CDAR_273511 [Caerostris darwini]|uniref:Uncharacterized protein n=1 Tax=Caerostris darwini TaxID=1538125 RepID=A0AAV4W601_9ARAC|nr:hypothetical protein CDAR_273511 [Caerostris darwini]
MSPGSSRNYSSEYPFGKRADLLNEKAKGQGNEMSSYTNIDSAFIRYQTSLFFFIRESIVLRGITWRVKNLGKCNMLPSFSSCKARTYVHLFSLQAGTRK